ncbi:MAG: hypothetical protein ACJAXH_002553 [Colwellia sp.]
MIKKRKLCLKKLLLKVAFLLLSSSAYTNQLTVKELRLELINTEQIKMNAQCNISNRKTQ